MATEKIHGRATIKVDGEPMHFMPGANLNPGGFTREIVMSDDAIAHYRETPVPAEISGTIKQTASTNIVELGALVNVTVNFESDAGPVYVIGGMVVAEPPTIGADGISITLRGGRAQAL